MRYPAINLNYALSNNRGLFHKFGLSAKLEITEYRRSITDLASTDTISAKLHCVFSPQQFLKSRDLVTEFATE